MTPVTSVLSSCESMSMVRPYLSYYFSRKTFWLVIYLRQRRSICFRPRARICLSVCVQDYSKMHAWIWMTCCVSTGIGTWTNWLTFEPDLGHGPDAWTGILSPIAYVLQRGNVEFYYVGKIPYTYWYWKPVEAAVHGFEASKHRCRR